MTIDEVKTVFERQFGENTFPVEYAVDISANGLYQFAHAVIREHLAQMLERQLFEEDSDDPD